MNVIKGRRVLLALSGGIAGYKIAELTRLLVQAGAEVQVMMSEAATQFITPVTLQALSGRAVLRDAWDASAPNNMPHINAGRWAEVMLLAPASADMMAKLAQGRADEIVSLTALARPRERCALLIAPAMNREMWSHPATQRNMAQLAADGAQLLGVGHGEQACGEVGDGRMLEAAELLEALVDHFTPKRLAGKRVLLTAGPTYEALDPVRGITNRSSGKMGFALAQAAHRAGAEVTLIAGPVHLPTPAGVRRVDVQSACQMLEVTLAALPGQDVFIATAAVADWRPASEAEHKIKKDGSGQTPQLAFTENPDILATVAARPDAPYCVGFAAESEKLLEHAQAKRLRKAVPLIVANLGPATFGKDDNALLLVDEQGARELPRAAKSDLAVQLIDEIAQRLAARP
ncbi:bifunctional phosphopantothenoylcysteine decarboxylase/phosphopantothenate--cysteine ligase CoaBC [Inhella gelatinilytica]|uniref:Coenzyme A biosynthesis bifunctional protein CoaBC n=1 Tax=Inhella gelatinilytica TaxID=2795030 RepID=A0A931NC38_9BURK|nr:bifunctional phosphopantothenoylcysteine decarboxylase/phosphopantothenate--cysteine ligase CoaBC [Inhella gelatinilytica]MBH9554268.1 bifunctional phosphopantothenoylcysteine decarboxylase/phosphopantothenate--cysteine ligase CoaBC [Inhella gelatinilytica]